MGGETKVGVFVITLKASDHILGLKVCLSQTTRKLFNPKYPFKFQINIGIYARPMP